MTEEQKQETKIVQKPPGPLSTLINYTNDPETQKRFKEMLGSNAGSFINSLINLVKNSKQLQACIPASIMNAALRAASLNLPIDPSLGYAAIVPYKDQAQFQTMYKGVIQLCIRSGQYKRIHNTEIYKDEIKSYNPINGELIFNEKCEYKMREEKRFEEIAGFYSYFKLKSGFECSNYITFKESMAHGKRFSRAYQQDLRTGERNSLWSLDPISMGKKTSIKMLLTKFGIMSIEMQNAFIAESEDFAPNYVDSTDVTKEKGINGLKARLGANKEPVTASPEAETQETKTSTEQVSQANTASQAFIKPAYCYNCKPNFDFDASKAKSTRSVISGRTIYICPQCNSAEKTAVRRHKRTDVQIEADKASKAHQKAESIGQEANRPASEATETNSGIVKSLFRCLNQNCDLGKYKTPFDNPAQITSDANGAKYQCPKCFKWDVVVNPE